MQSYKQPFSVLVILHSENRALLLKRCDGKALWQSVTGSIEQGETPLQTAQREVGEEVGIQAALDDFCDWQTINHYEIYPRWRHRYAPGVIHNQEHVFSLRLPENSIPKLNQREHSDYCWLDFQAASERVFSPSNAEALRQLATFQNKQND